MRRLVSIVLMLSGVALLTGLTATGFQKSSGPAADGVGGNWTRQEVQVLGSLHIKEAASPPADPSNKFEKQPAAVSLGQRVFSDPRFSSNGQVSCASCHDPKKQFQDGLALGKGVGTGTRRAMPIVDLGHSPWLFWDGRKDSLWAQALGPLEDSLEHGGNRLAYAHVLQANYRSDYEAIFGTMPDLIRLPRNAGPNGTPEERAAWNRLDAKRRHQISQIFANMGKAIAAYEKTLRYGESPFDRYVDGVTKQDPAALQALKPQEINGLRIFIGKGECVTCHGGPLLTDQAFHNTGIPPRDSDKPDLGRSAGLAKVLRDEFNCLGRFSDAKENDCEELRFLSEASHDMDGAFKTPSLRNVALRPPYMHAGQIASLEDVVRHYRKAPAAVVGHSERKPMQLSEKEVQDVVAFLRVISGPIKEVPPQK